MKLEGKAAVVTGASRGVGRSTAIQLADGGCAVLVNYSSSKAEAEGVVDEIRRAGGKAIAFQANVAEDADCRAMIDAAAKEFGRVDILVNNAGTTRFIPHSDLEGVTDEAWETIMGVNVRGPFQCARAAVPLMREAGEGEIVNVSSVAGVAAMGSSIPYCASKAALINMTVALARALGPQIRVNTVAPGFIEGEWLKQGLGDRYDKQKDAVAKRAVLGKVSQPGDIADAILAFITGSDMVTGQTMVVDGGMIIGPKLP
jgi:3-oxoacyl-[acyl-carrier protein] reductase